jgi:hypothetical protein
MINMHLVILSLKPTPTRVYDLLDPFHVQPHDLLVRVYSYNILLISSALI